MQYKLEQILELAKCTFEESSDYDWSTLALDEHAAFHMVGSQILEMLDTIDDPRDREITLLSSLIAVSVDNFLINLQRLAPDAKITKH